MECITKSDLIDKFIECSVLTPSDVMGCGLGTRWVVWVKGIFVVSFFCNYCFCVCVVMLLAVFGETWKQFGYFIVYFIEVWKPLLTYHFNSLKSLLTYQLLF